MKSFIDKYNEIMTEQDRVHAPYQQVIRTYRDILQSVGAYTDEKLATDKISLNALTLNKTKYDAAKAQLGVEFAKDGINKIFKDNMKKDGLDTFIKIADELDLWREFPPQS